MLGDDGERQRRVCEPTAPRVVSPEADAAFRRLCRESGRNPDDPWLGQYVDYEWGHVRYVVEGIVDRQAHPAVFEFGCNVGATAVVLAQLGAMVTAADIDPQIVKLARANARRYGVDDRITITTITDSTRLPYADETFDHIVCNSVLEYVDPDLLREVGRELNRVLQPGGTVLVLSTSNRLWPREVHSRRWISNYLPRALDHWFGARERGVFPWQITGGFDELRNADLEDCCHQYLRAKANMGTGRWKVAVLRAFAALGRIVRVTPGLLTPSIAVTFRKPER